MMFELATLVGVHGLPPGELRSTVVRENNRLALLPGHVYPRHVSVDSDRWLATLGIAQRGLGDTGTLT